jgi:hypothetical protein
MPKHNKGGSRNGRPRALSEETEKLINSWSTEVYPDMDREVLANKLIIEIEKQGAKAPTVSTLIAYISTYRNLPLKPQDYPWATSTLKDNPIPAETLPYVLKVNQYSGQKALKFSIRQAMWVSRLCHVIRELEDLYEISLAYAVYEKICDSASVPFDTSEPDKELPDPVKVMQAFEKLLQTPSRFKTTRIAFEHMTGLGLQGVILLTNTICSIGGRVHPVVSGDQVGLPTDSPVLLKSLGSIDDILPKLKPDIKSVQRFPSGNEGEGYYFLKGKPLAVEVSEAELLEIQEKYKNGNKGDGE